jgi:hypothetical protein
MGANAKYAGGRNLAGQRAPVGTDHHYLSKTTRRRLAAQRPEFNREASRRLPACLHLRVCRGRGRRLDAAHEPPDDRDRPA